MSCECDIRVHPKVLDIPPGLTDLPRAIGRFDDFRAGIWAGRAGKPALRDWSGQAPGDLGAMLVDFWAVIADVAAFYDQVRANEAYLGTAPDSLLAGHIGRLGYRPRPATAASVWVGIEAAGVKPRLMPKGTAFRSGPVGDGPPQIFESAADTMIYPAFGRFDVDAPPPATLAAAQGIAAGATQVAGLWATPGSLNAAPGDVIVAEVAAALYVTTLSATRRKTFGDEKTYVELVFDPALPVDPFSTAPDAIALTTPRQKARLWSATSVAGDPAPLAATSLVLSAQTGQVQAGEVVSLKGSDGSLAVARVSTARETQMTLVAAGSTTVTNLNDPNDASDNETFTVNALAVKAPTTQLTLAQSVSVGGDAADVVVGFGMDTAAVLAMPPADTFAAGAGDSLPFAKGWQFRRRWPEVEPRAVTALLVDPFGNGGPVDAEIDPVSAEITLGGAVVDLDLAAPVTAYGNAVMLTRGETVANEVLGVGNGALANQRFTLKKPLTYLPAPTEAGYAATLTVRVDGIEVAEVATLYRQPAEALVYTLREDDEGLTQVMFGDGIEGARLHTGAIVTADYRTGGGADRPEADGITQLVAPVDAVTSIHQPFAAFGGSDPEDAAMLRTNAPSSALLLGRAISLADFEAAAITQNGVAAAKATWAWSPRRQRPVAQVWFAGGAEIAPELSGRLRAMTDPATAIEVLVAQAVPLRLELEVVVAEGFREEDVLVALRDGLTLAPGARLAHAAPQIGRALFRSPVVAEALAVKGVHTLDAVTANGVPLPAMGMACAPGTWFTIDSALGGALVLNGQEGAA
jgi:hypothetical protein